MDDLIPRPTPRFYDYLLSLQPEEQIQLVRRLNTQLRFLPQSTSIGIFVTREEYFKRRIPHGNKGAG